MITNVQAQAGQAILKNSGFTPPAPSAGNSSWYSAVQQAGTPPAAQPQAAPSTGLAQGTMGNLGAGMLKGVADPLIRTGGEIEKGLDQTVGRGINAVEGKGFTPTHTGDAAEQTASSPAAQPQGGAQEAGDLIGTIAPYFTGGGEEETAAKVAGMIPKLAEHLGVSADSIVPKVIGYLAKAAPNVAKNTAVGTAQTGSVKQGAELGVGGEAAGEVIPAATSKAIEGTGKLGSQVLGAATGAGASSVKAGYDAAKEGSSAFTDAMRGKVNPDEVVKDVQDAVQNIANNRRSQYLNDLGNVASQKASLDISPIMDSLQTQLKNFGVKVNDTGDLDFSRSSIANNGSARSDIQGVYDTLKDWGTQKGDRTAVGLDTLKKQLGDFYSNSSSARAFVQGVKGKVGDILKTQVPGYEDMTKNYSRASNLLDDIKSATGAGGNSKSDTVFTKLTTAMKGDKDMRLEVLKEMTQAADKPDLEAKIAGMNMKSLIPKGLVGKMSDVGAAFSALSGVLRPELIPAILTTSPRVVGEFVNGLGVSAKYAKPLIDLISATGNSISTGTTAGIASREDQDSNKNVPGVGAILP